MTDTAVVIVPTTGADVLETCVDSVLQQTYVQTQAYVVCDGPAFLPKVQSVLSRFDRQRVRLLALPENVGANGYYGHRILAAATHLVNGGYVLYLDQDNWFDRDHVMSMVDLIRTRDLRWCYSLRKVCDKGGTLITTDDCESLGKWQAWTGAHLIDTSSYCLKREVAIAVAAAWHGGWGQDRVFYGALHQHFAKYDCTGRYTVNYRLGGNPGSVTAAFFAEGNQAMQRQFQGGYPWRANSAADQPILSNN